MRQLLAAAPVVVASHAERDGDERLTPSPALDSLPELAGEALAIRPSPTLKERQFAERPAMAPVADPAPPLGAGEQVSGGARILQLQAACPARAFFEVRLHAEELAVPPVGIDPLRRGQLVHRALEQLHLAMHERKLSPGEPAAAEVVTEISTRNASELLPATPLNRVLCELESTRLQFLLTELLRFDAGRPSFLTVAAERSFELVLGPLTLRLRADRVDQLADGSRLVIDYKTGGSPRSADWIGARPAEPQLPLYALAGKAQAVAIFRLNEEGLQAWGVAARDLEIPRIDPVDRITGGRLGDWRDLLAEWSANLTALANEFADGSCLIDARAPEAAAGAYASLSRLFHQAPSA